MSPTFNSDHSNDPYPPLFWVYQWLEYDEAIISWNATGVTRFCTQHEEQCAKRVYVFVKILLFRNEALFRKKGLQANGMCSVIRRIDVISSSNSSNVFWRRLIFKIGTVFSSVQYFQLACIKFERWTETDTGSETSRKTESFIWSKKECSSIPWYNIHRYHATIVPTCWSGRGGCSALTKSLFEIHFFIGNSIFHLSLELQTKFWKMSLKVA